MPWIQAGDDASQNQTQSGKCISIVPKLQTDATMT